MSSGLKWVTCRQHINLLCFFIHFYTLCLLIGAFIPFTFKVIIDMYVCIAILLPVVVSRVFLDPLSFSLSCFADLLYWCILISFSLFFAYLWVVLDIWLPLCFCIIALYLVVCLKLMVIYLWTHYFLLPMFWYIRYFISIFCEFLNWCFTEIFIFTGFVFSTSLLSLLFSPFHSESLLVSLAGLV